jgi:hypothetical protein
VGRVIIIWCISCFIPQVVTEVEVVALPHIHFNAVLTNIFPHPNHSGILKLHRSYKGDF